MAANSATAALPAAPVFTPEAAPLGLADPLAVTRALVVPEGVPDGEVLLGSVLRMPPRTLPGALLPETVRAVRP